jgi:hypothetical protein
MKEVFSGMRGSRIALETGITRRGKPSVDL